MCGAPADLDRIMEICEKHKLTLIEDCGQAMGAFHKGKSVGLFGKAGAFSFDYFKITTCGEGGVVITNSKDTYEYVDQVSDHGHTHIGDNRGMEDHYVMGFNYRMGELSAAIGLAQMRKLPWIIEHNRKNKTYLKGRISEISDISFRNIIDESGDSATFLNFFLPDSATTQKVFDQFQNDGVGGAAYWYTNMYHFINQWDHIKQMKFPSNLAIHKLGAPQDYNKLELPRSQEVLSRMVSVGIRCTWLDEELEAYADSMVAAIKKVI